MMNRFFYLILLGFIFFNNCSSQKTVQNKLPVLKKMVGAESIEEAGFSHLDPIYFSMLTTGKYNYIMNRKDSMIARFEGDKADRVYRHAGAGPGEFLNITSSYMEDNDTIAVYDNMRIKIFYFDLELNFIKENRVPLDYIKLSKIKNGFIAFDESLGCIFTRLDENFKIIDCFGTGKRPLPFKGLFALSMYKGHLLDNGEVADTPWLYLYSQCKADIIDLFTKKVNRTLEWTNPYPPQTQKTIDQIRNSYSSYYIGKHGKYYVVQNMFTEKLKAAHIYHLLVFDEKGKCVKSFNTEFVILQTVNPSGNTNIYFLDDDCNVYYQTIDELIK